MYACRAPLCRALLIVPLQREAQLAGNGDAGERLQRTGLANLAALCDPQTCAELWGTRDPDLAGKRSDMEQAAVKFGVRQLRLAGVKVEQVGDHAPAISLQDEHDDFAALMDDLAAVEDAPDPVVQRSDSRQALEEGLRRELQCLRDDFFCAGLTVADRTGKVTIKLGTGEARAIALTRLQVAAAEGADDDDSDSSKKRGQQARKLLNKLHDELSNHVLGLSSAVSVHRGAVLCCS